MRLRLLTFLALPFLLLSTALVGCDSVGGEASTTGSFKIYLTDAPGDFEKAVVTIESVSLHGEGGSFTLRDEPATVDLLTLQNEVMELVESAEVPAGTYKELRLVISGGYLEVEQADGSTKIYASSAGYAQAQGVTAEGSLQMPSFAQSGLKVKLPGGAVSVDGDQHVVLLDFVVAESFGRQAGASGMWVMTPVIHASDFTLTGGVEVSLSLDEEVALPEGLTLADFGAELDKGGDAIPAPFQEAGGVFTAAFRFLNPGAYDVRIVAPEGVEFDADKESPISFTVATGAIARDAVRITSVSASAAE